MPTRTQVIQSQLTKYSAQIEQNESAVLDTAILKFLICQMVDAQFSGGGGSTTPADIATGVDQSQLVDNIRANIDEFINNRKFRDETIAALQSFSYDTLLSDINNAISNVNASQITQTGITNAINNAVDIDTLIARLTSIDNKTVATTPGKTLITGFLSTGILNNNLLDPTGTGAWTDVRQYQSCELTFVGTPAGFIPTPVTSAIDATGTGNTGIGLQGYDAISGAAVNPGSISSILRLKYDLTGVNFIRVGNANAVAGHRVYATLNTSSAIHRVLSQISGSVNVIPITTTNVTSVGSQQSNDLSGTITTSITSSAIALVAGTSYQINYFLSTITGAAAAAIVRIQESSDSGITWRNIYTFEPITIANGNSRLYKSPLITATGNRIRYVETLSGTTPNINRTATRSTVNGVGIASHDTRSNTVYNAANATIDVPAYGIIRAISVMSTVATPVWLQFYDSPTPLVVNSTPRQSIRIPLDGLTLGAHYFGNGRQLCGAVDPRVVISSTANTYTPINLAANSIQLYIEAN